MPKFRNRKKDPTPETVKPDDPNNLDKNDDKVITDDELGKETETHDPNEPESSKFDPELVAEPVVVDDANMDTSKSVQTDKGTVTDKNRKDKPLANPSVDNPNIEQTDEDALGGKDYKHEAEVWAEKTYGNKQVKETDDEDEFAGGPKAEAFSEGGKPLQVSPSNQGLERPGNRTPSAMVDVTLAADSPNASHITDPKMAAKFAERARVTGSADGQRQRTSTWWHPTSTDEHEYNHW